MAWAMEAAELLVGVGVGVGAGGGVGVGVVVVVPTVHTFAICSAVQPAAWADASGNAAVEWMEDGVF